MTVEEIIAAMQALIAEATDGADPDPNAAPQLNEDQAARYEALEAKLQAARKSEEIMKRHAAWTAPVRPAVQFAASKETDEHTRAFEHFLRTGRPNSDLIEFRAQGEGSGSAGGYLVPEGFRNKLIERQKAYGGFGAAGEQLTTDSGQPLPFPTNDDTSNVGEQVAEGGTFASGADLVLGTRTLNAYKFMAGGAGNTPLKVSNELLQDSAINIQDFVARKLGDRLARRFADRWVNGSGIGEPQGILASGAGLTATTAIASNTTGPTYAELIGMFHTLDPAYRANAKWVFNDATMAKIEKLVDSNGRPLIWSAQDNLPGAPNERTLLGYPVVIDQAFPDPSGGNKFGFFGDIEKTYLVRHVKDTQLVVLNEYYAATGQVGFMVWARMDAMIQDVNAGVLLTAA